MALTTKIAWKGFAALAACSACACVVIGIGSYPAAAIMAGTAVGAVGINRAITGDCWGSCGAHRMCDHDSGMCVLQPCGGDCLADDLCENERCVPRRRERPAPPGEGDAGEITRGDASP